VGCFDRLLVKDSHRDPSCWHLHLRNSLSYCQVFCWISISSRLMQGDIQLSWFSSFLTTCKFLQKSFRTQISSWLSRLQTWQSYK
jgi:hypothetical protein